MIILSFELTMPNRGSWNGKWTGQDSKYYVIKKVSNRYFDSKEHFKKLPESWHYSWSDGWGANVRVEIIDTPEAKRRRKVSVGFSGYEWMIDSIMYYGEIMNDAETKRHLELKKSLCTTP